MAQNLETFSMKEIKKIDKFSVARIVGLFYGLVGFLSALFIAGLTVINIIKNKDFAGSTILVTLFNLGAGLLLAVLSSLITALLGWLIGFLSAIVYNIFAARFGGIKIDFTEVEEKNK